MSILSLIKARRSIRSFIAKRVPQRLIRRILEAGRWAPSGLNNQPWRFVVIRGALLKEKLMRLTESPDAISSANVLISVFLDKGSMYNRTKDLQSIGASIQNMLLEIHALGLGGCWLGEILNEKGKVSHILNVPRHYELMAVVAIGWPRKKSYRARRKDLRRLVYKCYP